MKVLVFCDDLHHPAATARAGLEPLIAAGRHAFDWIEDASGWNPGRLPGYDAVLLAKSNVCSARNSAPWLAGETEDALGAYVRAGGGLVAVHSGTASYVHWPAVRAVLGGAFLRHPPPAPVTLEPRPGHPLCAGVDGPFAVHDEHYEMILDDAGADVFLHARSAHGVQPADWARREGRGRVVVLTPGHFPEVWRHASMQRLIANALAAASRPPG